MTLETWEQTILAQLDSAKEQAAIIVFNKDHNQHFSVFRNFDIEQDFCNSIRSTLSTSSANKPIPKKFGFKILQLNDAQRVGDLLYITGKASSRHAVEWWKKISSCEEADVRLIIEVHGVETHDVTPICDGISLIPSHMLKSNSPNFLALIKERDFHLLNGLHVNYTMPSAFAVKQFRFQATGYDHSADQEINEQIAKVFNVVKSLGLDSSLAPTLGISWTEFVDDDLAVTDSMLAWSGQKYHHTLGISKIGMLNAEVISLACKFASIKNKDVSKRCIIALERINAARNSSNLEDTVLDAAIALESLLGDDGNSEIIYKLSLRAAILLENSLPQKKTISKKVKDFYSLRSQVAHGKKLSFRNYTDHKLTIDQGIDVTLKVLRSIVQIGDVYNPSDIEFT